jgi:nicotinamide-nucleotide amidase
MQAEIITVGDELLIGQVVDTNSAWLGQILNKYNIKIKRIHSISDDALEIKSCLANCLERSELIIITGGLGPTKDDITKKTLAEFFNSDMVINQSVLAQLETYFKNRGRQMLEINQMQAEVPSVCRVLTNALGTAPGMWFDSNNKVVISLPGVPFEMKHIFEHEALPLIAQQFKMPAFVHRTLVSFNVPESLLAKQIEDIEDSLPTQIKLAYLPSLNTVRLRLSGSALDNDDNIVQLLDHYVQLIKDRMGKAIVSDQDETLSQTVFNQLSQLNQTLSVAESCTGGYISHQLTQIPGASKVFVGSVISYSNSVKHHQLGVESTLFETVGAVSEQVVTQMVTGVRERLQTDYAIAISGIAGPEGGSEDKPVGTVFIGVSSAKSHVVNRFHFSGNRMQIIERSNNMALAMLLEMIQAQ